MARDPTDDPARRRPSGRTGHTVTPAAAGVTEPERITATPELATTPFPAEPWDELDRLTPTAGRVAGMTRRTKRSDT
jgi:hypothetical protein